MIALSLLVSLSGITSAAVPQKPTRVNHVAQLQIDTNLFPKESLEVVASCDIREFRDGDSATYVADNITISLVSHRIGYANHKVLHEYKDPGVYQTPSVTTSVPLWSGKYVPSDRFVLPSARVCKCEKGVYYVLCTGSTLTCFVLQSEKDNPARLTQIKPSHYPSFKAMWEQTFSPHDVYWCYYLVFFAKTFGLPNAAMIDHKRFIDTEYLDKLYTLLSP